jgi:putative acetyltransferase
MIAVKIDDLSSPKIHALLQQHLLGVALISPPESIHALDIAALKRPEITFVSAWDGDELLGCGALKELSSDHAEIKSMKTAAPHLRKGVARTIVAHLLAIAEQRSYRQLSLETGSQEAFLPARTLYASFGFSLCGPFAQYVEDPNSVFMTRAMNGPI